MVWLPVFGISNVYPDVDACDCTRTAALGEKSLAAPGTRTRVTTTPGLIDDLRKSGRLHSVRTFGHGHVYIYRSMPAGVAQSRHAFVGGYSAHVGKMTDTRKQKAKKSIRNADQAIRGEHADRIVVSPSW